MRKLLEDIERTLPEGGDWCSLEKATSLATLVVGLRPKLVVEIGVWMGGSLVPMLLAMKYLRDELGDPGMTGARVVAIDPWSPDASAAGQNDVNRAWWGNVDHEAAYQRFRDRLVTYRLGDLCAVLRMTSTAAPAFAPIDLLHVDGNHADQAYRDVEKFCPHVRVGGICVLDDVAWDGGHVARGLSLAKELGFSPLYDLAPGIVLQRRARTPQ